MIVELGHFALVLAFGVAILQAIVPMIGAQKGWADWMRFGTPASQVQVVLVGLSFAALMYAFVTSDFSVRLVAANSHSSKPMIYKITGVWANHEGSLLMWNTILAIFGAMVAVFGKGLPPSLKARVLSIQAMISVSFLSFILFTSNPFLRLARPPLDGEGLNPLLQDLGLAFHPPFLYLGYVGLSVSFSFAIAALLEGKVDAAWARWVRPWTLAAWVFLTIGIGLGSWWAYYELGWGGWWFWDPVENSSFMPWLVATALLHSAIVVEKRNALKSWTILLAILAFSFSLIGTFIVRSGVLTSVHAFATDPTRGMFVFGIILITIGGALTLFAIRASTLKTSAVFGVVSRESALVLNNLLLAVSAGVVFVGTIWPLIAEAFTGAKVSVGAPFFDMAFTPFMVLLAILLPIGSMVPWKRGKLKKTMKPLQGVVILTVVLLALVWTLQTGEGMLAPIGLALAFWVAAGAVVDISYRAKLGRASLGESLRRFRNFPRSEWGKMVSHFGLGIVIFAITVLTALETEDIRTVNPGERYPLGKYEVLFDGVESVQGPNYIAQRGHFSVFEDGKLVASLSPEKRVYPVEGMPTTEAGIQQNLLRDLYIVVGDKQDDGSWAVRSYIKPFTAWLWIGLLVMSFGGLLSLSDRRYRVAAPANKPAGKPAEAVPAE